MNNNGNDCLFQTDLCLRRSTNVFPASRKLPGFLSRMHSAISAEVSPGFVQFLQRNDRVVQYLELGGHLIPKF